MKKEVTKSVFGKKIDKRCPGYNFFEKLLVWCDMLSDVEASKRFDAIDEELKKKLC